MPSTGAIAANKIQDLKAQSLSTLMATLDPLQGAAKTGANLTGNAEAAMQSVEAAIRAVVIENSGNGRAILQIAGGMVEAELPPELLRAAMSNPNLLKPGATLTLPAGIAARPVTPPATVVEVQIRGSGPSVGPAPPLATPFPPGSLGAIITRLAGIVFPQGEPEGLPAPQIAAGVAIPKPASTQPGLAHSLPPEIAEAVLRAANRQIPLAAALTQILSLGEADLAKLPADIVAALRSLQAVRAAPEAVKTPDGLQNAVKLSGLFLEANLAGATTGQPVPADLKAVLLALRSALGMAGPETADPEAQGSTARPSAQNNLPAQNNPSTLAPRTPTESAHPEIARAVEGAVERLKLMQMASMPDHPEIRVTDDRAQPMRLALSIPLATQGLDRPHTAVMGLMVEHHPQTQETVRYETEKEGGSDTEPFPWKVRVALDLEETGPVQAEIALRGQSVAVTLWAERTSMAALARNEIGALHDALTGAAFDVVKLEVKDGRPQGKPMRAGPLLDRRT